MLRPAFYRQLGESYGAVARATCALEDHDAPDADCSCGFYAVADDTQLWRLGADEPELAVLDVELAGRVIEHDHGYRASDQVVRIGALPRGVRALRPAGRGVRAASLRRPRARVPPLRAAGDRADGGVRRRSGCRSSFTTDDPAPAPLVDAPRSSSSPSSIGAGADPPRHRRRRARHRVGHPARVRAARHRRVAGDACRRCSPRLGERLGIGGTEAVRLQHRWSPVVAAVAIGCDIVLTVVVIALRDVIVY